jgi:Ca2+-binding EF-hand superfamily protein
LISSGTRSIDSIVDDVRQHFLDRGIRGIVQLQRRFRIMDDDNSKTISLPELKKAMRECSIALTDDDCYNLFQYFDKDKSGAIDFDEFVEGIKV